jgi:hypothetical protein
MICSATAQVWNAAGTVILLLVSCGAGAAELSAALSTTASGYEKPRPSISEIDGLERQEDKKEKSDAMVSRSNTVRYQADGRVVPCPQDGSRQR